MSRHIVTFVANRNPAQPFWRHQVMVRMSLVLAAYYSICESAIKCCYDTSYFMRFTLFYTLAHVLHLKCVSRVRARSALSENFALFDQMSPHVATFAKDPGPLVSCRVATFA